MIVREKPPDSQINYMLIGEIGHSFQNTEKISFLSDRNFMDFDFLIIDYNAVESELLSVHDRIALAGKCEKRKKDLEDFFLHKKLPLIIFSPANTKVTVVVQNTHVAAPIESFLPIPPYAVEANSGKRLNVINNTIFTDFLNKHEKVWTYNSCFTQYVGTVICEVPHMKNVVAFFNSKAVFLPTFNGILNREGQGIFLDDLFEVINLVNEDVSHEALPEWSYDYLLPLEKELKTDIEAIKEEIASKSLLRGNKENELLRIQKYKTLFTGTGNALEAQVKSILEFLGFQFIPTEQSRTDLVVKYNEKPAVIEIKGVIGSAAEKFAAQLEKWVADYYAEHSEQPKGILIVNAYKDQDLNVRTMDIWPHQMLKYSKQKELCLITSIQLLGIYLKVNEDPSLKDSLVNTLFETIGIYKGFENWADFLGGSS